MAQTGYTPILIYASGTATNVPLAANLTSSASGAELALNYADGKLYYKDSGGTVQILATKAAAQNSISFGTTGLTPSTATQGAVTVAGTLITSNGGTGLSSWTAGDLPYYATGTALSKLGIGTNGQILTSSGTAPQWSTLSGVAVTTFSAGTTGFTPSSATSGAVTLAGTLATTNGGTGLTSFTANGVVYASSTSALATGSALTFDGTSLGVGTSTIPSGVKTVIASPNTAVNSRGNLYVYTTDTATADYGAQLTLGGSFSGTSEAPFAAIAGRWVGGTTGYMQFSILNSGTIAEQMRLTSTGLGIGTSSPSDKLQVTAGGFSTIFSGNDINFTRAGVSYITATGAGSSLSFGTANTTGQMFLDSSGNLGLGVTPPAWSSGGQIAMGNNKAIVASGEYNNFGANWYYNGVYNKIVTGYASNYYQAQGAHIWQTAGTGSGTFSFTSAMTLDASGNLGVGTTTLGYRLSIGDPGTGLGFTNAASGNFNLGLLAGTGSADAYVYQRANANLLFGTNNTERARIYASGGFVVGSSVADPGAGNIGLAAGGKLYYSTNAWITPEDNVIGARVSGTSAVTLWTGGSERVRIDSSGNLLVGTTTSPSGSNNMVVAGAIVSTRINPRVSSTTSTASITPDISAYDQYCVTAQAATLTINAPIGTPVDGNKLMFRILDNGGSQTLTWNATFTAIGVTLPTATTASKMTYVGCIYNAANTRWDVVAVTTQA